MQKRTALRAIGFVFLVAFAPKAEAFINIESLRQKEGTGTLGSASINLNGQTGNTETSVTALNSLTIHRLTRDEILFLASYNYGVTWSRRDRNNGQAHLRYTFQDREPLAYEVFTQGEYDQFKNLESRGLFGVGLRKRLIKNENTSFYLSAGAMYEKQEYKDNINREGLRANTNISYAYQYNERYSGSTTLYYQPLFEDWENFRVRHQIDIDFNLSQYTALFVQYQISHDSWVPPGIEMTDTQYLTGFKVTY